MYTTVKLTQTERNLPITPENYPDFYHDFQVGVLLTLKAEGLLDEIQFRNAESALKQHKMSAGQSKKGRGAP